MGFTMHEIETPIVQYLQMQEVELKSFLRVLNFVRDRVCQQLFFLNHRIFKVMNSPDVFNTKGGN